MIEDKVVADISDEVLEFVKPNIFERKMLSKRRKESVTEERILETLGFINRWTKGCNGYTCDINDAQVYERTSRKNL
jgi:hypothetical protein